jgi:hypothetical protein
MTKTDVATTIAEIRSNKVRMYLRTVQAVHDAKEELQRHIDEAKRRRAGLTGGEWAEAQRFAVKFQLDSDLV